ncbi:hypothetical protein [Nesterenkonia sp. PF2B19]|uniref:hypothetical protein n=1 Tax=Nesterenkonia sp. PF2B19 TaxID=1881858 RepID=UPI00191C84B0|nr:hypothetical protein [Nesterenkonia sp. PF2B19]
MDTLSPRVETLGVLNTVVHRPDGLAGDNTDVDGIVAALEEAGLQKAGLPTAATERPPTEGTQGRFGVIGAGSTAAERWPLPPSWASPRCAPTPAPRSGPSRSSPWLRPWGSVSGRRPSSAHP